MADWHKNLPAWRVIDYDPEGDGQWIPHRPVDTSPEPVPFRPPPPDWEQEERERLAQICDIEPDES